MNDLRECRCSVPVRYPQPSFPNTCVRCGFHISPLWTSNDLTVGDFFNRLATVFPTKPPQWFHAFRSQCEARERAGRTRFGHSFLSRDNIEEAIEEAADLAIYAHLHILRACREQREDHRDLAMTAALKAAEAYHALTELRARETGAP